MLKTVTKWIRNKLNKTELCSMMVDFSLRRLNKAIDNFNRRPGPVTKRQILLKRRELKAMQNLYQMTLR